MQPLTGRVFIDLDNPSGGTQRISFRECANRHLKMGRLGIKIKVGGSIGQGHGAPAAATASLLLTTGRAIFDQQTGMKGAAVIATESIWTIERFPIHGILPRCNERIAAKDTRCRVN